MVGVGGELPPFNRQKPLEDLKLTGSHPVAINEGGRERRELRSRDTDIYDSVSQKVMASLSIFHQCFCVLC